MKKISTTRLIELFESVNKVRLNESAPIKEAALMNEISLDVIKKQFVDSGKISEEKFNEILQVSNNKLAYAVWLIKRIVDGVILDEDVYKYKDYFRIFEKYKNQYPIKDINQIKTKDQITEFIRKFIEIRDNLIATQGNGQSGEEDLDISNKENLVSSNDIQKLKSVGINFLGMVDGYQVFEIPKGNSSNETFKTQQSILGRCKDRDRGQSISICTMGGYDHFNNYTTKNNLYVFFNLNDPKSPYQFYYGNSNDGGGAQFMDKDDNPLI